MKKYARRIIFLLVCSVVVPLLVPSYGAGFQTIKWGEDNELSIYGFLRNDLGMFTNTLPQGANGNKLAGAKTTLRGYGDFKLGEHFKAHAVVQLVWEPPYPVERGATSGRVIYTSAILHGGKEYSEYKNINDLLREAYVEWEPNKIHNIRAGRQIVIWGESLTDMVLDVVHPPNLRTGFFAGNQEDARIPQWMLRGIHQISNLRSSFEWVINPLFVGSMYRVGWVGMTGERFAQYPEDRTSRWPFIPSAAFLPDNVLVKYPNSLKDLRYGFRTTTYD